MTHQDFTSTTALEAESRIVAICAESLGKLDLVTAEPADFMSAKWRSCFEALRELQTEFGEDADPLVLMDRVAHKVEAIQLSDLVNVEANPAMIGRYSEIVREEASKRRLRLGLSKVLHDLENGATASEGLSTASRAISDATIGQPDASMGVDAIVRGRFRELAEIADRIAQGDESATGLSTGIEKLDETLGGLQPGIVTLLAARPAMGKSALALGISNAVSKSGFGVHLFSLEDTRASFADRVLSMGSEVSSQLIRDCRLSRKDMALVQDAAERIQSRKNWLVDDRSGITAEEIVRCARRKLAANGTKLVVIDYIGLVKANRGQYDKRIIISDAINCFGDAAKADGISYLVLSQLNRSLESRDNKRPMLSDLKESGTLEERSKAVVMLYRPAVYGDKYAKGQYEGRKIAGQIAGQAIPESVMEILVRKNSNGKTGTALANWQPTRMRIS